MTQMPVGIPTEPQSERNCACTQNNPYTFSPVTVTETFGAVALALVSLLLLIALLRSQAHARALERLLARRS